MYLTGSTANTANPAKDFMEITLHPNLLTAGFTYVEEVVSAGTSRTYKSATASNGVGDWYLVVFRTSDNTTSVQTAVCEDYDSTGHLAKKFAPYNVTAGQTLPADRSHYTTAGVAPNTLFGGATWSVGVSTSAHSYVLSLHPKRAVISTRVGSQDYVSYAGLYESMLTGVANHFPLCVSVAITASTAPYTSYTREPGTGTTVATASGQGTFTANKPLGGNTAVNSWTQAGPTNTLDGYHLKPTVSRILAPPSQTKNPGSRGMGYGVYGAASNTFAYGDVATIDWSGSTVTATCISAQSGNVQLLVDQAW